MRSKKSLINILVTLFYFVFNNVFAFVSKSIFISYLGIEYAGLNAFLLNIIGVLNLAELGISTSVGYALYKPLQEKKNDEITEILSLFKYLYRIIGVLILGVGLLISLFLDKLVTTDIPMQNIRIYFLLYLLSVVTSYFLTYTNILPSADQKNYVVVRIQGNVKIVKNIIELAIVILFRSYLCWLFVEIIGNISAYVICNIKVKNSYREVQFANKGANIKRILTKYYSIIENVKNLFFHQIGSLVVNQTDNIIISKFCNLVTVGKYTNYTYIYSLLTGCVDQAFNSITGSIGNLLAEDKHSKKSYSIWQSIYVVTYFIAGLFAYLFFRLSYGFVSLWVGGDNILANKVVFCVALNIFFRIIKAPTERFKVAYGIFYDKYAPLAESIINLLFSLILVQKFDVLGVVIGTVISNFIIIFLWKPYITFKDGFKQPFLGYMQLIVTLTVCSIGAIIGAELFWDHANLSLVSWKEFIVSAVLHGIASCVIMTFVFMFHPQFRKAVKEFLTRIVGMLKG